MKKRNLVLGFAGAIGAAVAVKMLTRAKTVDWENVADLIPHSENSKFVSVDGARVHYQEFGDASKPTIVMIHGYTASLYVWKTVVPVGLVPLYLLEMPLDPTEPRYVAAMALVVATAATLFVVRKRVPWLVAAVACYAIIVSPVLGFAQSGQQKVADRYTYLACMPFAVLGAAGVRHAALRWPSARNLAYSVHRFSSRRAPARLITASAPSTARVQDPAVPSGVHEASPGGNVPV